MQGRHPREGRLMALEHRLSRRQVLRVGLGAMGVGLLAACAPQAPSQPTPAPAPPTAGPAPPTPAGQAPAAAPPTAAPAAAAPAAQPTVAGATTAKPQP